jgi:predicted  nucleic acid-binding Zn-ribbon protein
MSNIPRFTVKHSAKLRSAPSRGTASSVYLRMHQLANEQERLERELQTLSDRTREVVKQIAELQNELSGLSGEATLKLSQSTVKAVTITPRSLYQIQSASGKKFNGMTIDY